MNIKEELKKQCKEISVEHLDENGKITHEKGYLKADVEAFCKKLLENNNSALNEAKNINVAKIENVVKRTCASIFSIYRIDSASKQARGLVFKLIKSAIRYME